MTNDRSASGQWAGYPVVTIAQARELTGLDLVSAKAVVSEDGRSYHDLEELSESKSHKSARDEAIGFFFSYGYQVLPEGVGIDGVYTLADFLAIRASRVIFVEVLSDTNVTSDTLNRKAQLQRYAKLCFVVFCGNKKSNGQSLMETKRAIESWADVLYCSLHGYDGNRIEENSRCTVAFNTTRELGIRVALRFRRSGGKLLVSLNFLTHLYENSGLPVSYRYEEIFLDLFKRLQVATGGFIRFTSSRSDVTAFRSMRRKAGLKMVDRDSKVIASLRSEYRGPPVEELYDWTYHPSSRDLPPSDVFGVFVFENATRARVESLIKIAREYGFSVEFDVAELDQSLSSLVVCRSTCRTGKQSASRGTNPELTALGHPAAS